jgi:hypothetical protein
MSRRTVWIIVIAVLVILIIGAIGANLSFGSYAVR